jgi:hypothetical protein
MAGHYRGIAVIAGTAVIAVVPHNRRNRKKQTLPLMTLISTDQEKVRYLNL